MMDVCPGEPPAGCATPCSLIDHLDDAIHAVTAVYWHRNHRIQTSEECRVAGPSVGLQSGGLEGVGPMRAAEHRRRTGSEDKSRQGRPRFVALGWEHLVPNRRA